MNTSKRALVSDSQTAAAVLGNRTELDAIDAINVQFESRYNGRLSTDATLTRGLVSFQAIRSRSSDQTQNHSLLGATMNGSPWNVLHVISNDERRVEQHLVVRSIEHYLPLFTERVKWTDRTAVAERPLFSGYVFVRFSPQSRIILISTPGVLHPLGDGERDMVRDEELTKIRDGLASGLLLRPHPSVSVGARVQVRDGVFAGAEGIVTEFRRQYRVIIALSATRQCFSLEVELAELEVLKKPAAKTGLNAVPAYGY